MAHEHHIPSARFMTIILGLLLTATALTVYTALKIDLGQVGNLIIALLIAAFKAALVVGFFMHLHWDNRFNACVLLYCLIAAGTFLLFTTIDMTSRGAVDPWRAVTTPPPLVDNARERAIADGRLDEHGNPVDEHAEDHGHSAESDGTDHGADHGADENVSH